jgi:hypothetical protein
MDLLCVVCRFSSEILAILFQTAGSSQVKNVIERRPDDIKRITNVLKRYVGKDPGSESEKEFASNLINILSSILLFHSDAQVLFANAGGLELALNLIRYFIPACCLRFFDFLYLGKKRLEELLD